MSRMQVLFFFLNIYYIYIYVCVMLRLVPLVDVLAVFLGPQDPRFQNVRANLMLQLTS